jgi:hypothetical protein
LEWLDKLQAPGLILAGLVIWLGFRLFLKLLDAVLKMIEQRSEDRSLLMEMAGMLRQLCSKERPR